MTFEELDLSKIYLIHSLGDLPTEEWIDIIGFEGWYKISSLGRVKSLKRNQYCYFKGGTFLSELPRIMKPGLSNKGYVMSSLTINGEETKRGVHCLVGEHFIDNPLNLDTIDHISTIKTQNNFQNLRWGTRSQNTVWAQEIGITGNLYTPKFNKDQVLSIFNDQRANQEIAREYGVDKSTISLIKVGKNYSRFTGKKHQKTKTDKLQRDLVVKIYSSKESGYKVAEKYGINPCVVFNIRSGKTYTQITNTIKNA